MSDFFVYQHLTLINQRNYYKRTMKEENKIDKLEKTVGSLASEMRQGFSRVDKAIEDLAASVANGFSDQNERFNKRFDQADQRFEKVESDISWMRDVLEDHTTVLNRLDQERIFTLNYIQRLEKEVAKIKKQLKIA